MGVHCEGVSGATAKHPTLSLNPDTHSNEEKQA